MSASLTALETVLPMATFGSLEKLRERPTPDQRAARRRRLDFRNRIPSDETAPEFTEPLVDLRSLGIAGENYYFGTHNPPGWRRGHLRCASAAFRDP